MLLDLRITNLALIEHAEIECGAGLNVLTGETGAGKSILVQALGLLVGERAAAEHVGVHPDGEGGARALVEGAFDLSHTPALLSRLRELDFVANDEMQLVIARDIAAEGRSRVRLNSRLATAAALRDIGGLLVDLHGQHENQLLLKPESHLSFLDEYGDAAHHELMAATAEKYAAWKNAQRRLDDVSSNEQRRAQRLDMLQFQAGEIDEAALEADEEDQLKIERERLVHAERLRSASALCRDALHGDETPGAIGLAREALKAAREIAAIDKSVETWVAELESAIYQLDDAAAEARSYADTLEADPLRLEDIEARLHRIGRLKKKYGESVAQILAHRAEIETELQTLNMSEAEVAALQEAVTAAHADYEKTATKLSATRQKLAAKVAPAVVAQLQTLALEHARFEVHFEATPGSVGGVDGVEFLFCANPGQPLRPLTRIASGGEISRVMLALRTALSIASHQPQGTASTLSHAPVIVFDEIDTGIGGVTAEAIGEKMHELARHFQVFCVTHLPQIAKRADRHYRVHKESDAARTRVSVTLLQGEGRVKELARMMGQESDANLRHAREMLKSARAATLSAATVR